MGSSRRLPLNRSGENAHSLGVREVLHRGLESLHRLGSFELASDLIERLEAYVDEIHRFNAVHRIVGPMSPEAIASEHVVDSLGLIPFVQTPLLDVGSGAGLPGLVLKLALPQLSVTLVEPRQKPASFLALMRARFGLQDLVLVDRRAEEVRVDELAGREPALCATAKGFGTIQKLWRASRHLLRPDAILLVPSSSVAEAGATTQPHPLLPRRFIHRMVGLPR